MNARVTDDKYRAVPPTIRDDRRWMVWRFDDENGNRVGPNGGGSKVPYQTNGKKAKSNNAATWTTFEAAAAVEFGAWEGVAIAISPDDLLCGIDLDNCFDENGGLRGWAIPIINKFDGVAYAEISPSGRGIKLLSWAEKPAGSRCVHKFGDDKQQIECYDHDRFWTITGKLYSDFRSIEDGQFAVDWLCETYLTTAATPAASPSLGSASSDLRKRAMDYVAKASNTGEGGRNQAAFGLAGNLRAIVDEFGQGLSGEEILSLVRYWNQGNKPPLDDNELQRAVRSGMTNGTPRELKLPRRQELYPDVDLSGINQQFAESEQFDDEPFDDAPPQESPAADPRLTLPQVLTVAELQSRHPLLREPLLEGLLRVGETMNVIAATKVGKTWLVLYLAFAVAFNLKWLGVFQARQGRVLLCDNELHAENLAFRLRTVAAALSIRFEDIGDKIQVLPLRGRSVDINGLGKILEQYPPGYFSLIICDAKYRFEARGAKENSNEDQRDFYNFIDALAAKLNCSLALVHHASKGGQGEKAVTDVGAGGGGQSRATDTHLVLRPHEVDGAVVLDAAVRSFKPVAPCCLRFTFPIWHPADELDPTALKLDRPRRQKTERPDRPTKPVPWSVQAFVDAFVSANPVSKGTIIVTATEDRRDGLEQISTHKAETLLKLAESAKKVFRWKFGPHQPQQFSTLPQPVVIKSEVENG